MFLYVLLCIACTGAPGLFTQSPVPMNDPEKNSYGERVAKRLKAKEEQHMALDARYSQINTYYLCYKFMGCNTYYLTTKDSVDPWGHWKMHCTEVQVERFINEINDKHLDLNDVERAGKLIDPAFYGWWE